MIKEPQEKPRVQQKSQTSIKPIQQAKGKYEKARFFVNIFFDYL
jgi:hypothetical protein